MDLERNAFENWCSPFYQDSALTYVFLTVGYVFLAVPFLWFFAGFWNKEFYTLYYSLASALNGFLVYALRAILRHATPKGGCTRFPYGMPSLEVTQAFFLAGFFFSYLILFNREYAGWVSRVVLVFMPVYAIAAGTWGQVFLGANTVFQVIASAPLGIFNAVLFQSLFLFFVYPRMRRLLETPLLRKYHVHDTLCDWKLHQFFLVRCGRVTSARLAEEPGKGADEAESVLERLGEIEVRRDLERRVRAGTLAPSERDVILRSLYDPERRPASPAAPGP